MKVWNEKALQTSLSRSLVLGFIFVLKESLFAISVLYQEGYAVIMRHLALKEEKPWQKKEKCICKCICQLNCSGDFEPRLALCERFVMSPWGPSLVIELLALWNEIDVIWNEALIKRKHDSFANEKEWKWIVSNWGVLAPEIHTSPHWTRNFQHWHVYT